VTHCDMICFLSSLLRYMCSGLDSNASGEESISMRKTQKKCELNRWRLSQEKYMPAPTRPRLPLFEKKRQILRAIEKYRSCREKSGERFHKDWDMEWESLTLKIESANLGIFK